MERILILVTALSQSHPLSCIYPDSSLSYVTVRAALFIFSSYKKGTEEILAILCLAEFGQFVQTRLAR